MQRAWPITILLTRFVSVSVISFIRHVRGANNMSTLRFYTTRRLLNTSLTFRMINLIIATSGMINFGTYPPPAPYPTPGIGVP